jgi:hypothetical protein
MGTLRPKNWAIFGYILGVYEQKEFRNMKVTIALITGKLIL